MAKAGKNGNGSISFDVRDALGVLSTSSTGWNKEVNVIAWNDAQPKLDIRDWDENHEHMSKGITLHRDEARELFKVLESLKDKDFEF